MTYGLMDIKLREMWYIGAQASWHVVWCTSSLMKYGLMDIKINDVVLFDLSFVACGLLDLKLQNTF